MFNSKHKKKYESDRGRVSRRHAIKNSFIALAGVKKKKKKRRTQIVIQVILTPGHCGLLLDQIKKYIYRYLLSNMLRIYVVLCSANEFYNVIFCRRVSEYFDTKDKNNATPVTGQVYFS